MRTPLRRAAIALIALAAACLSGGCAAMSVQPWDRDLLAQKKMSFDPLPMLSAVDEHIRFSKEGSMGGRRAAGGGCGCN